MRKLKQTFAMFLSLVMVLSLMAYPISVRAEEPETVPEEEVREEERNGAGEVTVTMVTVTELDHPKAGAHPDTKVTVTTEPAEAFLKATVSWTWHKNHNDEISIDESAVTFEPGEEYRPWISVTLNDGYKFESSISRYDVEGWRQGGSDYVGVEMPYNDRGSFGTQWEGVNTTAISITGFQMPVAGEEPVWTLPTVVTDPEGAFQKARKLEWHASSDKNGYTFMKAGDKFEAGQYYRPAITVDQKAYCNWQTADGGSWSPGEAYTGEITADERFSYPEPLACYNTLTGESYAIFFGEYMLCPLGFVSHISITGVEKPGVGKAPDTTADISVTPAGACAVSGTVTWECSVDGGETYTGMDTEFFVTDKMYRPCVKFTLNDEYWLKTASGDGEGTYTGTLAKDEWIPGYEVAREGSVVSCIGAGFKCGPKGVVYDISIAGIEGPVAAGAPGTEAVVTVTPAEAGTASYTVTWECSADGGKTYAPIAMPKFEAGKRYRPCVTFSLADDYVLRTASGDGLGAYTGTASMEGWPSGCAVDWTGTTVTCRGAGVFCEPKGVVVSVTISGIDKFYACALPTETTATVESVPEGAVEKATVSWRRKTDSGEVAMASGNRFLEGQSYRPLVQIELKEGYLPQTISGDGTGAYTGTVEGGDGFAYSATLSPDGKLTCLADDYAECRNNNGGLIKWSYNETTKTLTISGEGEMGDYGDYLDFRPWNEKSSDCKKIVVSAGVTSIGGTAFANFDKVTAVELPEGMTKIGKKAFQSDKALTEITLPQGVELIDKSAFYLCSALAKITLPRSLTTVAQSAFSGCTVLKDVHYKGTATEWDKIAIDKTANQNRYLIGATRTDHTSAECPGKAPTCTEAGYRAYYVCDVCGTCEDEDFTVAIPDSNVDKWKSEGGGGYLAPAHKKGAEGSENVCPVCREEAGWIYDAESKTLTIYKSSAMNTFSFNSTTKVVGSPWFGYRNECEKIVIRDGVTKISRYAFRGFAKATDVTIPEGVTEIGMYSFTDCAGLTEVTIPSGVTSISTAVFASCTGLTKVTIPEGVTSIGGSAFTGCKGLKEVTIPESVTSIGSNAFSYCSGLKEITIPESVTSIEYSAFMKCTGLTEIRIPESVTSIGNQVFDGCGGLKELILPSGITKIGNYTFRSCSGLKEIRIPEGVTSIGNYAFMYCTHLTGVTIPKNVDSIGSSAFDSCYDLESVTIPKSVTSIWNDAFNYCTGLKTVYYAGTDAEWDAISIGTGNDRLTSATRISHADCKATAVEVPETASTCTAAGHKAYYRCGICGRNYEAADCTQEIMNLAAWKAEGGAGYLAAAGHVGVKQEGKAATCTEAGYKECYRCFPCGKYFTGADCAEEITSDPAAWKAAGGAGYLKALGHLFGTAYLSEHGDGEKHYHVCQREDCGVKDAGEAHTWNVEAATATEDKHCTVCGYETEPALGHTHEATLVPGKAATCTEAGVKDYYTCTCGKAYEDEACTTLISDLEAWKAEGGAGYLKAGHTFAGEYVKTNADAEKHYHVCKVCGAKDAGEDHTWNAEAATETVDKHCEVCGYVAEPAGNHEHKGTKVDGKEATCLEAGIKEYYTCECGMFFEDEACEKAIENIVEWKVIPALGHDLSIDHFDEEVHWKECSRCGEVTPKEAHVYDGPKDKDCNVCSFVKGLYITIIHAESVDGSGNASYTYSGSPIKPEIIVRNYSRVLTEGVDYTVSYKNNTKASEGVAENKKPAIVVKGKGNYAGTTTKTFEIVQCPLEKVTAGAVTVVKGSKAVPVLIHNGILLGKKDYTNPDAATKFTEDKTITLTGQGNYKGSLSVNVKVVPGKADLKKFKVALGTEKPVYDGTAKKVSYTVTDAATGNTLTEGTDYIVTYQKDIINAGKVKVSFTGINNYTGNVAKVYTIKPNTTAGMSVTGINAGGYDYQAGGVKPEGLKVTCTLNGTTSTLKEGKDYTLAYSNFAKMGSAKYTVKFLGNYKGTKALNGNYTVNAAVLDNATVGLKVSLPDMVYGTKPGTYASKPVVSVGGVLLKPAEYTVNYYADEALTKEIKGKENLVTVDSAPVTVYVKITGKGNYGKDTSKYATASYQVVPAAGATDLKNVKITFRNADGTVTGKFEYTGKEVEPEVLINGTPADLTKIDVTYHNNIQKGKATVVIRAKAGSGYAGGKTANFSIVTKNVGKITDLWRKIFS